MGKNNDIVAISGYYGFDNIGDEAILYSILQSLREIDKNIRPIVFSNNPEKTSKLYDVEAVNRWSIHTLSSVLFRSRLLISGGGSLLQDVTGLRSLGYYLGVVQLAKLLKNKVMFYAQGIGPINTAAGKKMLRFAANNVDLITVRDEASKELLKELQVKRPPIKVTVDPVLGLSREKIGLEKGRDILKHYGVSDTAPVVGISIRDWKELSDYKKSVAKVADNLIQQGYQVLFIPFHFPGDIAACRNTMRLMKNEAFLLKNSVTVEEMLSLVGNLEMMIGMRLHSLIMAAVMTVPMVGISYDPKVDNFLKMVFQPNAGRVETLTEEGLNKNLAKIIDNLQSVREELRDTVNKLSEKAKENVLESCKLIYQK
jgi:polysaccharide pyruvyl transferase CsaB